MALVHLALLVGFVAIIVAVLLAWARHTGKIGEPILETAADAVTVAAFVVAIGALLMAVWPTDQQPAHPPPSPTNEGIPTPSVPGTTTLPTIVPSPASTRTPQPTNTPSPTPSNVLAAAEEVLIAGSEDQLYAYDGDGWTLVASTPNQGRIRALLPYGCSILVSQAGDPGTICTYDSQAGRWKGCADTPERRVNLLQRYGDRLFAGTSDRGYILEFNGSEWTTSFVTGDDYVLGMGVFRGNLYISTGWRGTVYEFDGTTWTKVLEPDEQTQIVLLPTYREMLYLYVLHSSTDARLYAHDGTQWSLVHQFDRALADGAVFDDRLYIGSTNSGNIYRYDGDTVELAETLPISRLAGRRALAVFRERLYLAALTDGVWVFDGRDWWRDPEAPQPVWPLTTFAPCAVE
jgi:hypothetical protein